MTQAWTPGRPRLPHHGADAALRRRGRQFRPWTPVTVSSYQALQSFQLDPAAPSPRARVLRPWVVVYAFRPGRSIPPFADLIFYIYLILIGEGSGSRRAGREGLAGFPPSVSPACPAGPPARRRWTSR